MKSRIAFLSSRIYSGISLHIPSSSKLSSWSLSSSKRSGGEPLFLGLHLAIGPIIFSKVTYRRIKKCRGIPRHFRNCHPGLVPGSPFYAIAAFTASSNFWSLDSIVVQSPAFMRSALKMLPPNESKFAVALR